LADIALLRDADLPRGREAVERALVLLEDAGPEARFDALEQRARIGWWLGDLDDYETYVKKALAVAQEAGRADLEANAYGDLAYAALTRLDVDSSEQLAGQALELADASGNRVARGWALVARGRADKARGRMDLAEGAFLEAADVFSESGASWALARVTDSLAWLAWARGDLGLAERRFREAIRVLQPTEDRGALCEIQRGLAQLLVDRGQIEEAERWALEARKTVGPHDMASRASTRMALGIVRAAQGRDEEAEELLVEALEIARRTQITVHAIGVLETLVGFLRERGRLEEAAAYEDEVAALRSDSVLA
jgi:tetratricopeptide (TPR) repeat protein